MHITRSILILTLSASVAPVLAQPMGRSDPGNYRSEVRLQGWSFENFFQVSDPGAEQQVRALGTELRSAFQPRQVPFEVYGHLNYLVYDEIDRKNTYGARLGLARDSEVHDFNVFVDRAHNRTSLDFGDIVASADVTTASGEYSYRLADWELGAEGTVERHRFDVATEQDSDYTAVGASVRYRGFGWKFSPEVGYTAGRRSSDDSNESYDEPAWYAQLVYMPHARVYLSLRYRQRERHYESADTGDINFGRVDERPQWSAVGTFRLNERFTGMFYYSSEDVSSSRPGRDFDTSLLILGLVMRL